MDPTLVHLISLKLGYSYFTKLFIFFSDDLKGEGDDDSPSSIVTPPMGKGE